MGSFSIEQVIGVLAGCLSFFAYILYVVSMIKGRCRPNRMTWMTLTVIGIGLAVSYFASGARETMWVPISYVAGPFIISLFSFKYGEGGWSRLDRWCIFGVIVSVGMWWLLHSPLVGLVTNLLVDLFALLPTMEKSLRDPAGEDRVAWSIETVSNIMNLFAVTTWTFAVAVYPVYLLAINLFITLALWWPRRFGGVKHTI